MEVDHVLPLRRDPGQDPYDLAGLQTLCKVCHRLKTSLENRRDDPAAGCLAAAGRRAILTVYPPEIGSAADLRNRTSPEDALLYFQRLISKTDIMSFLNRAVNVES